MRENGAALELYDVDEREPLAGLIYLERIFATDGPSGGPIRGVVTHRLRTEFGRVIICVAFTLLSYQHRLEIRDLIHFRAFR